MGVRMTAEIYLKQAGTGFCQAAVAANAMASDTIEPKTPEQIRQALSGKVQGIIGDLDRAGVPNVAESEIFVLLDSVKGKPAGHMMRGPKIGHGVWSNENNEVRPIFDAWAKSRQPAIAAEAPVGGHTGKEAARKAQAGVTQIG